MSNVNDLEKPTNEMIGQKKEVESGDASGVRLVVPAIYHLNSSDSPGNVLIVCRLNGDNYLTWSRAMRTALKAKNKLPFIDGSLRKPDEDDPNRERWEMCNSMLIAWIFNTMEEELQAGVACATDASSLWDDLKERYSQGNQTRIYQLKSEICLLKQEGQAVQKYYSKMKTLWDELENYLETPKCNCGAIGGFMEQKEKEKGYQFLMGLDPEFATVRSNILSVEPMPSLNKIYSMIVHEERQKAVARSHETKPEAAVFLAKSNSSDTSRKFHPSASFQPSCDFCGKAGHTKSNCWALHGYPSGWEKERGRKSAGRGSGSQGSRKEVELGRWKQHGPAHSRLQQQPRTQMQHGPVRANAAQTGQNTTSIPGLTEAQFQKLLSMIGSEDNDTEPLAGNKFNFVNLREEWILDTGASTHMTGCFDRFIESSPIKGSSPVHIPNGGIVQATRIGKVQIG